MNSRRDALKALAAGAVLPTTSAQQHSHSPAPLVQVKGASNPKFFTAEEIELAKILVDLVIPRTETPGASDANSHFIIDGICAQRPAQGRQWRAGLKLLGKSFPTKDAAHQRALLKSWSEQSGTVQARFFRRLKDDTIDAYYSTREGLVAELGWNANTFLPDFKGCTHPEHQESIL